MYINQELSGWHHTREVPNLNASEKGRIQVIVLSFRSSAEYPGGQAGGRAAEPVNHDWGHGTAASTQCLELFFIRSPHSTMHSFSDCVFPGLISLIFMSSAFPVASKKI